MNEILGKYRLIAELAHGGMGTVYLAVAHGPAGFNKLVVIKQLRPAFAEDAHFTAMFLQEARLAAYLHHPNIVQTYEVVCDPDRGYYIVMEYLEGASLKGVIQRLRARGSTLVRSVYERVILDILTALEYAHDLKEFDGKALDLVHRDVNPDNVLVLYGGHAKLLDFGIAKAANSPQETQAGILKGKLRYMAPEQMAGDPIDRRADLFAVGGMLWDALTGRRLWEGMKGVDVMAGLVQDAIPRPRSINFHVSEELDRICMRALAFKATDRYPSAASFRADLQHALGADVMSVAELSRTITSAFALDQSQMRALIAEQLRPIEIPPRRPPVSMASEPPPPSVSTIAPPPSPGSPAAADSPLSTLETAPGVEPDGPGRRRRRTKFVWAGFITAVACLLFAFAVSSRTAKESPPEQPSSSFAEMPPEMPLPPAHVDEPAPAQAAPAAPIAEVAPVMKGAKPPPKPKLGRGPGPGAHFVATARAAVAATPASAPSEGDLANSGAASAPAQGATSAFADSDPATVSTPSVNPAPSAPAASAGVPVAELPSDLPKGAIAAAGVIAVVRSHAQEIQHCFDTGAMDTLYSNACESVGKTPAACRRARVNMSATVAPDGHVTHVSTAASRDGTSRLEECIRGRVQSWTFPEPSGGVPGHVTYPFVFE